MLDVELFGLNPAAHHGVNLLLHLANTLLLLLLALRSLTGAFWRSLAVAALFALHPLRVESVAWVAERKDLLAGLFFMLALLGWARYCRRPGPTRYLLVLALAALGLMAKPMLVTLPCVLLLLDFWPLRRLGPSAAGAGKASALRRALLETLPFFILSVLSAWITFAVARQIGATASLANLSLAERLGNALTACASYLLKLLAPLDLSVYYPLVRPTLWPVAAATLVLAGLSVGAFRLRTRAPYLLTGWLWFLIMLGPVIGLVQVGGQAMADRYTYLPGIGLLVAAVWSLPPLAARFAPRLQRALPAALVCLLALAATVAAHRQTGWWRDSETLYLRTLAVTKDNFIIHYNLAVEYAETGRRAEALAHYDAVLVINPGYAKALNNKAWILATAPEPGLRNGAAAVEAAEKALQVIGDNSPAALDTYAAALAEAGRFTEAAETATRAATLARAAGQTALAGEMDARTRRYQAGLPYHQRAAGSP